jgi:tetratricopeptide (TPR) repeat protein
LAQRRRREKGDGQSIADASKAIELDPNMVTAYESRSLAYFNKGDWDRCIADASKGIELDPKREVSQGCRMQIELLIDHGNQYLADKIIAPYDAHRQ